MINFGKLEFKVNCGRNLVLQEATVKKKIMSRDIMHAALISVANFLSVNLNQPEKNVINWAFVYKYFRKYLE